MKITNEDIQLMVENVLMELAQNNIVDNFDWVENFIQKNNPNNEWGDNFYYVTIQQRKKDNDNIGQRQRYIRTYEIFTAEQLDSLKKEIIFYCQRYNARAYILLNHRSLNTVDFYTDRDYQRHSHQGYERDFNAGRQLDIKERPIAHIDIDSEDINLQKNVLKYLKDNGITILHSYRTPNNGLHIVIPNKELVRAKNLDFHQFGTDVQGNKGNQKFDRVDMIADRPIILYANTLSKGYDDLNKKYASMIRRNPSLGH